jgi:hypothetical protein
MSRGTALLAGLLAAAAAVPFDASGGERIVLVPLENLTRAAGAREAIMPALAENLERKGYEVIAGEQVEAYLRENRIRYLDSLPVAQTAELLSKLGADVVMVGSILAYDRRRVDPLVALALNAIGPKGQVLWSDVGGLAASESKGPLEIAKTSDLAVLSRRLVARMLEDVPRGQLAPARRSRPYAWGRGPRVFRSPEVAGRELTVCVLPLQNLSGARDAARVAESAIQHRLAHDPRVTPVLSADLRKFVVDAGLRAPSRLTLEQLERLAKSAGTPYFLHGSIFAYGMTGADPTNATAVVEVYLRLLDVTTGQTVWSGLHKRTGADYEKLLLFGAVRDPATLTTHVIGELLDAFTRR